MDEEILKQIFDELLSALEALETQSAAALQFLKAKGIATDEELAPFLAAAGNVSNVRWLAVRVRTAALISSALKPAEKPVEAPAPEGKAALADSSGEAADEPAQSESEKPEAAAGNDAEQKSDHSRKARRKKTLKTKAANRTKLHRKRKLPENKNAPNGRRGSALARRSSRPAHEARVSN